MWGDTPYEEWIDAVESTAEELLWESDVMQPPVDAFLIALRLGVVVTEDEALEARAHFVRLAGGTATALKPTIVLGDEERFERRQFAVAHELGEFAAQRVFDRLSIDPRHTPHNSREHVANALAGRLLLPRRWFRKHGVSCDWDLPALKETFWTASHELIARRMLEVAPPAVITVFDQGHVTWRRSGIGQSRTAMLDAEYECWQRCHATGIASTSDYTDPATGDVTIRCWPVHEEGWRREIMRTEVPEW